MTPEQNPQAPAVRPKWYRRQYLVYPKFQLSLILVNALITTVVFGFITYQVVRAYVALDDQIQSSRLPAQNLFVELLNAQLQSLVYHLAVGLIVSLIFSGTITLIISNKMAGPITRLKEIFIKTARTGEWPENVHFRQGDFFIDLPPIINQAVQAIKRRWNR